MDGSELPQRIDMSRLGNGEHAWQGSLADAPLSRMEALGASVRAPTGAVRVEVGRSGLRVSGECAATVTLECERCLEPVALEVAGGFDLLVVDRIEEADRFEADQPVVVAPKGQLDVAALLEDELILALPVIPTHDNRDCDGGQRRFGPAGEAPPERDNPFQALESLKRDDSSEVY